MYVYLLLLLCSRNRQATCPVANHPSSFPPAFRLPPASSQPVETLCAVLAACFMIGWNVMVTEVCIETNSKIEE